MKFLSGDESVTLDAKQFYFVGDIMPPAVFCSYYESNWTCLLYTSDAADEGLGGDLGGRRIIKKK